MTPIKDNHHEAMRLLDEATEAKRRGNELLGNDLLRRAFALEKEAALLCRDQFDLEPTRSVLFRSAASLALDCKEFREAERLIAHALVGNPPVEIADELRDLLQQMYAERTRAAS